MPAPAELFRECSREPDPISAAGRHTIAQIASCSPCPIICRRVIEIVLAELGDAEHHLRMGLNLQTNLYQGPEADDLNMENILEELGREYNFYPPESSKFEGRTIADLVSLVVTRLYA